MSEEAPLLATPLLTTLLTTPSVTELIQDPGPRAAEGPWGVNLRIHRIKQCNGGQFSPISDQSAPRKCRHLRYSVGFGRTLANFAQIDAGNPTSGGQQTGAWSRIVYKIESPSWGLFRQQSTNFSTTPYIIEMPKSILFKPVGIRNAHQSQSLGMGNFRVGAQVSAEFGPNSAKIRPRSAKLEENWRESTSFGPKSGRVQQSSYTFGRGSTTKFARLRWGSANIAPESANILARVRPTPAGVQPRLVRSRPKLQAQLHYATGRVDPMAPSRDYRSCTATCITYNVMSVQAMATTRMYRMHT